MGLQFLSIYKEAIIYVGIALVLITTYLVFENLVKRSNFQIDHKRRLLSNFRGFFTLSLIFAALLIWSTEIYSVILPFTAVAAAIAIASKEFLLCIGGGFYKTFSRPFSVGDRIEIDSIRGDVIEFGFLSTQLMEVGPGDLTHQYTGRAVTIPNSLFLTKSVTNETFSTDYVLHIFTVPVIKDVDWKRHRDALYDSTMEVCEQYLEQAIRHFAKIASKRQLDLPAIKPRINVKFSGVNEINLVVRATVPSRTRGLIEQQILQAYLDKVIQ